MCSEWERDLMVGRKGIRDNLQSLHCLTVRNACTSHKPWKISVCPSFTTGVYTCTRGSISYSHCTIVLCRDTQLHECSSFAQSDGKVYMCMVFAAIALCS